MALTPEEMEEIKAELAGRMGGQQDLIPGAKPKLMDVNSTVREGENGFEKESKYWIKVLWDGKNLDDGKGCYWNEWLEPNLSDIFQEETS